MARSSTARRHVGSETPAKEPIVVSGTKTESSLDTLIHERHRLAIVSTLAVHPVMSFSELRDTLDLTDGNLSVHAQKLEAAGLIECHKTFDRRTPRTEFRLTKLGLRTLEDYLAHMERIIARVRAR